MENEHEHKTHETIGEICKSKEESGNRRLRHPCGGIVPVVLLVVLILLAVNTIRVYNLSQDLGQLVVGSTAGGISTVAGTDILPTGVPEVYGAELGIKYDDVSASNSRLADATIAKLAAYDTSITLTGDALERYIDIGSRISCEYCCGAASIIFTKDTANYKAGDAACGCSHSYAMRGLAKYLLTYHSDISDDEILEELGKWKVLFFPDIHIQKAQALEENGIEINYINLASNKYRGIEQGATGGSMVGGC